MRRPAGKSWTALSLLTTAAVATGGALVAAPAGAAYPGANGAIVYSSDRDGDYELYTRTVSGTGAVTHKRLTDNTVSDSQATYSPDGTRIAFTRVSGDDVDIWVMNADGSNQRQVTKGAIDEGDPTWSPDGTRLAFTGVVLERANKQNREIFTVDALGTETPVNITNSESNDMYPAWSVDNVIAFVSGRDRFNDVFTMSPTGANVTQLNTGVDAPRWPTWSPDGDTLAFIGWDNTNNIYLRSATGAITRITDGPYDSTPAWSPDGTQIVYRNSLGNGKNMKHRLYTVEPRAGATPVEISDGGGQDFSPDWQPVPAPTTPSPSSSPVPVPSASCDLPVCL